MSQKHSISARNLARIAGQCIAMSFVIHPAKLLPICCYYKIYTKFVYKLLRQRHSWDDILIITQEARQDLTWWQKYVNQWNHRPVIVRPVQAQITTDASHLGWGAVMNNTEAAGQWNYRLSQNSSNHSELMAIFMALLTFLPQIKQKSIQVQTDNITAMTYPKSKQNGDHI